MLFDKTLILMRGGGDLATGAAIRLVRAGFPLVIAELDRPLTVRRAVAFASALLEGQIEVEGLKAVRAGDVGEAARLSAIGVVPVLVDPGARSLPLLKPSVLVDARMTKSRVDVEKDAAPLVVGLGPGFIAGVNCHAVVETRRGPYLGRVYWHGAAQENTGKPETVMGLDYARVLRAPRDGTVLLRAAIGDAIAKDQVVAAVDGMEVRAPFPGILRGLIAQQTLVTAGMKIGDIDPRGRREYSFMVSDKSLAVGGGVLEAILSWLNRKSPEVQG